MKQAKEEILRISGGARPPQIIRSDYGTKPVPIRPGDATAAKLPPRVEPTPKAVQKPNAAVRGITAGAAKKTGAPYSKPFINWPDEEYTAPQSSFASNALSGMLHAGPQNAYMEILKPVKNAGKSPAPIKPTAKSASFAPPAFQDWAGGSSTPIGRYAPETVFTDILKPLPKPTGPKAAARGAAATVDAAKNAVKRQAGTPKNITGPGQDFGIGGYLDMTAAEQLKALGVREGELMIERDSSTLWYENGILMGENTALAAEYDRWLKDIKKQKAVLRQQIAKAKTEEYRKTNTEKYNSLAKEDDFGEMSKAYPGGTPPETAEAYYAYSPWALINNDVTGAMDRYTAENSTVGGTVGGYNAMFAYVSDEEKATFNYICNKAVEEEDGYTYRDVEEYLAYLTPILNGRMAGKEREKLQSWAEEHPVASSIASVNSNMQSGLGLVNVTGQNIRNALAGEEGYRPVDYNSAAFKANTVAQTSRNTVSGKLSEKGSVSIDEEKHPTLAAIFNGKSWADVYDLGMSMADSTAVLALAPVMGEWGTVFLGGSAGTQGMLDAVARGATDSQALAYGWTSGLFETLFEKVSLGNLLKAPSKHLLIELLKQGGVEASEELFTSLANNLADAVIMGGKSVKNSAIKAYMAKGLSFEEAKKKAAKEQAVSLFWDAMGGFISGGIMGGGHAAVAGETKTTNREAGKTAGENISAENSTAQRGQNEKNSAFDKAENVPYIIERDDNGNVTVRITSDILNGKSKGEWASAVREVIGNIFKNGITLPRGTVFTNKKGRGEFTNGSYTRMLERTDNSLYEAKMRMAPGTGAMVENAENVEFEPPAHDRADDIVGFNRGNIRVIVENSGYTGDVLTAVYSDGKEVFFDVNNISRENTETSPERYAAENGSFSQTGNASANSISNENEKVNAQSDGVAVNNTRAANTVNSDLPTKLVEASKKYGEQAETMLAAYKLGQDVGKFIKAYDHAWQKGKLGASSSEAMNGNGYLTLPQRKAAYKSGSDFRKGIKGSETRAQIAEFASRFGNGADIVRQAYKIGQDPKCFAKAFENAWRMGRVGAPKSNLSTSPAISYLTPEQRQIAYDLGKEARIAEENIDRAAVDPAQDIENSENSDTLDLQSSFNKRIDSQEVFWPDYSRAIKEAYGKGTSLGKNVLSKFMQPGIVETTSLKKGSYFDNKTGKIYLNGNKDLIKIEMGRAVDFFHEHGHYIDFMAAGAKNVDYISTRNTRFREMLMRDFGRYVQKVMKENTCTEEKAKEIISVELYNKKKHGISDIFEGLSDSAIQGCAGHAIDNMNYWKAPGKIEREAFAHMFQSLFDRESMKYMSEYFPEAFKEFKKMIKELM